MIFCRGLKSFQLNAKNRINSQSAAKNGGYVYAGTDGLSFTNGELLIAILTNTNEQAYYMSINEYNHKFLC